MPAVADFWVACSANQSDITSPSKPHWPRRMSRTSGALSPAKSPLMRLYEVITACTFASLTAFSNGTRYSSRIVRSSTTESIDMRSTSLSLQTKCLIVAATPWSCSPRM